MNRFCVIQIIFVALMWGFAHATSNDGAPSNTNAQGGSVLDMTLHLYSGLPFENFLEQKGLGEVRDGVWILAVPPRRSPSDHLGNLSYSLELFNNYAIENGTTFEALGIDSLRYESWSFGRDELRQYMEAAPDVLEQTVILRGGLSR